jgi:hypothetical protein
MGSTEAATTRGRGTEATTPAGADTSAAAPGGDGTSAAALPRGHDAEVATPGGHDAESATPGGHDAESATPGGPGSVDVAVLTTRTIEAEIIGLARRLAGGTHDLLVLVGEYDRRGHWATRGALSCAAWLADVCDIEVCTARTQVRVARAMRDFPDLAAAVRIGAISYAKARVLVPHLTADNVTPLLHLARTTPAGRLGVAIARWSRRNEDPTEIDERHRRERSVTVRTEPSGMVVILARLPPVDAVGVVAVIDAHLGASSGAPAGALEEIAGAAGTAENSAGTAENSTGTAENVAGPSSDMSAGQGPGAPAGASPGGPTLAQQRADALVRAPRHGGGAIDTEVVLHLRGDLTTLQDGTPVSDHAVAGLLDEAFVSLLLHDMDGHPIDASPRRRSPTRRQRRVLDERQPTCARDGCTARQFLQYDHVERHSDGGPTVLDNLQRLCGPHNRQREQQRGRW